MIECRVHTHDFSDCAFENGVKRGDGKKPGGDVEFAEAGSER